MKRALRRFHVVRLRCRARKIAKTHNYRRNEKELEAWYVKNINNLASCSCFTCGNPRKMRKEVTKQEIIISMKEKEQKEEIEYWI